MKKVFANLTVKIGADTKQFTNQMRKTKQRTSALSKQFSKLGAMMAGAFGIYAVGRVVSGAIKTNIRFEKSMADVQAITKATGAQMALLEKDALKLGASTEHTASAVASLQKEYGKLGFSTKEILAATSATLDLATATGEELALSAEAAGATIRGFGKSATETRAVTDLMAASFTSSALDLNRWSESMKYAAPIAKVAGYEIEEVAAALAIMADAGIHGSMAGTAFKKIMSKMSQEGKTMAEVIGEAAEKGLGLAEAEKLVGERGKAGLLILADQIDRLEDLTTEYKNAGGSAKVMADIQRNTLSGSIAVLSSAWEGLMLGLQSSKGIMKGVVDGLTSIVSGIGGLLIAQKKVSDAMEKERIEVNALVGAITSANISQKTRNRLIDELHVKYPDFIGNIDKEKISNEQLVEKLKEVNDQYKIRIAQQIKSEQLADIEEKIGRLYEEEYKWYLKIQEAKERDNAYTKQNIQAYESNIARVHRFIKELELEREQVIANVDAWLKLDGATKFAIAGISKWTAMLSNMLTQVKNKANEVADVLGRITIKKLEPIAGPTVLNEAPSTITVPTETEYLDMLPAV
ncbi:MAG: phage tail tape measure protein, partial [Gammaproteobacteria bacterium]